MVLFIVKRKAREEEMIRLHADHRDSARAVLPADLVSHSERYVSQNLATVPAMRASDQSRSYGMPSVSAQPRSCYAARYTTDATEQSWLATGESISKCI